MDIAFGPVDFMAMSVLVGLASKLILDMIYVSQFDDTIHGKIAFVDKILACRFCSFGWICLYISACSAFWLGTLPALLLWVTSWATVAFLDEATA